MLDQPTGIFAVVSGGEREEEREKENKKKEEMRENEKKNKREREERERETSPRSQTHEAVDRHSQLRRVSHIYLVGGGQTNRI